MWPCKAFAILFAQLFQVVVLFLQNCLGSVSLLLVAEILIRLVLAHVESGTVLLVCLVASLLWKDVVLVLDDEVYVQAEVFVEAVELGTQLVTELQFLLEQLLIGRAVAVILLLLLVIVQVLAFVFDVFVLARVVALRR